MSEEIVPQVFDSVGDLESRYKPSDMQFSGVVYAVEYDEMVKVGCTKNPIQRMKSLMRSAEKYGRCHLGRIAVSMPCTNYAENEKTAHQALAGKRKAGTELFSVSLDDAARSIWSLPIKDESEEINERSKQTCQFFARALFGDGKGLNYV